MVQQSPQDTPGPPCTPVVASQKAVLLRLDAWEAADALAAVIGGSQAAPVAKDVEVGQGCELVSVAHFIQHLQA